MARVCDDWIHTYLEWTLDRSESPDTMILWSGLIALSSVLKRRVRVPKKLMGGYDIYPNLYVIFVAPPGVARKSTTVGRSEELLREVDNVYIGSTAVSASKLVADLSETIDGSMTLLPSELGTFMNVSHEEMYDLLTDLFDNKEVYTYSTRMHGVEIVERPCLNFLAATTPRWVEQQMPIHVIGGGFASRCIFIFEDTPRQRRLYYDIDVKKMDRLKEALVSDLKHISGLEGSFRHDSDKTRKYVEDWYQGLEAESNDAGPGIEGYYHRKHLHLHKIAMLLSIAESDSLVLKREHFEKAEAVLKSIEEKMPHALVFAGSNPLAESTWQMWNFIKEHSPVKETKVFARFMNDLGGGQMHEVLATLVQSGSIERIQRFDGNQPGYRAKRDSL